MKPYQVCSFIIFLALLLTTFCYPDELGANYYDSASVESTRGQIVSTNASTRFGHTFVRSSSSHWEQIFTQEISTSELVPTVPRSPHHVFVIQTTKKQASTRTLNNIPVSSPARCEQSKTRTTVSMNASTHFVPFFVPEMSTPVCPKPP